MQTNKIGSTFIEQKLTLWSLCIACGDRWCNLMNLISCTSQYFVRVYIHIKCVSTQMCVPVLVSKIPHLLPRMMWDKALQVQLYCVDYMSCRKKNARFFNKRQNHKVLFLVWKNFTFFFLQRLGQTLFDPPAYSLVASHIFPYSPDPIFPRVPVLGTPSGQLFLPEVI